MRDLWGRSMDTLEPWMVEALPTMIALQGIRPKQVLF